MIKARRKTFWIGLIVLAIIGLVIGLSTKGKKAPEPQTQAIPPLELAATDIATVSAASLTSRIEITGTLDAINKTTITSPVEAEIAEVFVRPGMYVKKGQPLLRFATTDLQLRLNQQKAQVDSAKAQVQLAKTTYQQQKALLQQQFISENAYQNAQSALTSAESTLKAAEAQFALAQKQVGDARVTAPFDAQVAQRQAEPGQRVGPNTALMTLVDSSELELEAAVGSHEISQVKVGQPVKLYIDGFDGNLTGTVARIAPAADSNSRRIPVFIKINDPEKRLRAGLFAHGIIAITTSESATTLPISAIQRDANGQQWVWRVVQKKLQRQPIVLGLRDSEAHKAAVLQGLQAGDMVLTIPGDDFREGQTVAVKR